MKPKLGISLLSLTLLPLVTNISLAEGPSYLEEGSCPYQPYAKSNDTRYTKLKIKNKDEVYHFNWCLIRKNFFTLPKGAKKNEDAHPFLLRYVPSGINIPSDIKNIYLGEVTSDTIVTTFGNLPARPSTVNMVGSNGETMNRYYYYNSFYSGIIKSNDDNITWSLEQNPSYIESESIKYDIRYKNKELDLDLRLKTDECIIKYTKLEGAMASQNNLCDNHVSENKIPDFSIQYHELTEETDAKTVVEIGKCHYHSDEKKDSEDFRDSPVISWQLYKDYTVKLAVQEKPDSEKKSMSVSNPEVKNAKLVSLTFKKDLPDSDFNALGSNIWTLKTKGLGNERGSLQTFDKQSNREVKVNLDCFITHTIHSEKPEKKPEEIKKENLLDKLKDKGRNIRDKWDGSNNGGSDV